MEKPGVLRRVSFCLGPPRMTEMARSGQLSELAGEHPIRVTADGVRRVNDGRTGNGPLEADHRKKAGSKAEAAFSDGNVLCP